MSIIPPANGEWLYCSDNQINPVPPLPDGTSYSAMHDGNQREYEVETEKILMQRLDYAYNPPPVALVLSQIPSPDGAVYYAHKTAFYLFKKA